VDEQPREAERPQPPVERPREFARRDAAPDRNRDRRRDDRRYDREEPGEPGFGPESAIPAFMLVSARG
jgi:hypothetical protein